MRSVSDDEDSDDDAGDNKNGNCKNQSPMRYGDEVDSAKNVTWIISTDRSIGARVYAAFPANNMFYWGYVIAHEGPVTEEGTARYSVLFEDGDIASDLTKDRVCTEIDFVQVLKINPPLPNPDKTFRQKLKNKLAHEKARQAAAAAAAHVSAMRKNSSSAVAAMTTPIRKASGKRKMDSDDGRGVGQGTPNKKSNTKTVPDFFASTNKLNHAEQAVANRVFSTLSSLSIQTLDNADTSGIACAIRYELGGKWDVKKSMAMAQEMLDGVRKTKKGRLK